MEIPGIILRMDPIGKIYAFIATTMSTAANFSANI
jgi:hypothetical protein